MNGFLKTNDQSSRNYWVVLTALSILLLVLAALRPLSIPDEGRYADIGRAMLQSGDWLVPRLNGIPFFHKPPMLHWLLAASIATFGVTTWAARVIPALSACLLLAALHLSSRILAGAAIARRATIMLGTSLSFLIGGQFINHDMLVAAWISIAVWCFALAMLRGTRQHAGLARLGFIACAIGVLSKGLIGVVLPGLVLVLWILWTRQFRRALELPWASGILLFMLITVPWFVIVQHDYPGMFDYLFGTQQLARYIGHNFNNVQPWWFYGAALGVILFPWPVFALTLIGPARGTAPGVDPRVVSLCWCWLIAIVIFFSVPSSKLVGYILPVTPPLALLSALGWQRCIAHRRWSGGAFSGLATLAVVLAIAVNTLAESTTKDKLSNDVANVLGCAIAKGDSVYTVGGYPHDLPFLANLASPMVVVQDWSAARAANEDNWRRELFEGAEFDSNAAGLLQAPDVLESASQVKGHWLVAPRGFHQYSLAGWSEVWRGTGWILYRGTQAGAPAPQPALGSCGRHPASRDGGLPASALGRILQW